MINKNFSMAASAVAAAIATVAVSAGSANAVIFSGDVDFTLNAPSLDAQFSNATVGGIDPDFSSLGTPVNVQPLTLTAGPGFTASNPSISSFISGFQYKGIDAVFNLMAGSDTIVFPSLGGEVTVSDFVFNGQIKSLTGALLANATGAFSGIETATNDNFSVDLAATPVPTPAMLPGLVGMGMAFARKRKQQAEAA